MLLSELLGVKKLAGMTRPEIGAFAEEGGAWKKLGKGAFAHAYERNGVVYKFWFKDEGYEYFIDFCKKHRDCKFLPKFLSDVKRLPAKFMKDSSAPDDISYIKMEKLQPYNREQIDLWKTVPKGAGKVSFADIVDVFNYPSTARSIDKIMDYVVRRAFGKTAEDEWRPDEPDALKLFELITEMQRLADRVDIELDIANRNLAARGDTPVIIDPFYRSNDWNSNTRWSDFEAAVLDRKERDKLYGK